MATIESQTRLVGGVSVASVQSAKDVKAVAPSPKAPDDSDGKLPSGVVAPPVPDSDDAKSRMDLGQTVEQLNELVQQVRRELHFSVDESSGKTVITVIDSETDEVVREIPPEQVFTLVARLTADQPSLLMDETV